MENNQINKVIELVGGNAGLLLDSIEALLSNAIEETNSIELKYVLEKNRADGLQRQVDLLNEEASYKNKTIEMQEELLLKAGNVAADLIEKNKLINNFESEKILLKGKVAVAERKLKESKIFGDPRRLKSSNSDLKSRLAERTKERDMYKKNYLAEAREKNTYKNKLTDMGGLSIWNKDDEKLFLHHSQMTISDNTNGTLIKRTFGLVWWHPCGIARLIIPDASGQPLVADSKHEEVIPCEEAVIFAEGYFNQMPNKGRLK